MKCKLCGDYYVFTGKNGLCVCCESKLKRMGFYEKKEIAGIKARAEAAEAREKNLHEAIQMLTARAEKAEKKLEKAVSQLPKVHPNDWIETKLQPEYFVCPDCESLTKYKRRFCPHCGNPSNELAVKMLKKRLETGSGML